MNEYLERALVRYFDRLRRRHWVVFLVALAGTAAVVAWVLLARPADGWTSTVVPLVGLPCAVGVVVGAVMTFGLDPLILRWLREGYRIRSVKRGVSVVRHKRIEMETPAIFVELDNDRTAKLLSLGDMGELARIEELLRKQMEQQPAKPHAA